MNLRQKKKRYKRIYGQNPEKDPDGRYIISSISDQYREPEDSIVVTTRCLSERRRKGGNPWKRKGR